MNFQTGQITKSEVESKIQQSLSKIKNYLDQAEFKMRDIMNRKSPQSFSQFESLLKMADLFEALARHEIANYAYYAHNLLNEIGASVSPQGTNVMSDLDNYPVAQQAKIDPANISNQQKFVNKDELGDLFDGIHQSVTNEFNMLLQYLQQHGVLV